ncbi:MAG: MFS transporter [Pseudomonadota bacterium]
MTSHPTQSDEETPGGGAHTSAEERVANWNYAVFVVQGIAASVSKAIGSPRLLLPYLYVATGAPVFLAGTLMPLVSVSRLVGQVVAAPVVSAARTRKWFLFAGWMTAAVGLAAAGLGARIPSHWVVMVIFAVGALAMGFAKGLNGLAFNDLMSLNLSKARRNSGIFLMSAAGGVVTITVTWLTHRLSSGTSTVDHDINLALVAAAITALAAIIIVFFRETKTPPRASLNHIHRAAANGSSKPSVLSRLRKLRDVLQFRWFRRYLLMRVLTATVVVAMPFYAVHGATHHAHKNANGLSVFVIATSVAVIICGPMWQWLGKRSQRFSMALGSALVGVAGIWALTIDEVPSLQTVFAHSFVFALAAAGIQAVNGSRMLFLIDAAPKEELTYYVAVSNTVSATLALIVASLFGYIAQLQGVHWPVLLVTVLNFASAAYALSLKEPSSDEDPGGTPAEAAA